MLHVAACWNPVRRRRGSVAASPAAIDRRTIAPRERHALVFARFDALQAGQTLQLVNDHDPKPLYYQFQAELGPVFTWDYLETGPEVWKVRITRKA